MALLPALRPFFQSEQSQGQQPMIGHPGEILILTGAPGSGKTTIAKVLADRSGSPKVHLHADDFWRFIKNGAIPPYLPQAHQQNAIVIGVLAKVAAGYAEGGYFVIVDGIVGPWFLPPFELLDVPLHYVVLRSPLDLVIARCSARGGDALSDPDHIAALHQQFTSLRELERHALAVGDEPSERLAELVVRTLDSGTHRVTRNRGS